MAARAAMELGIQYVAFARNPEHSSWLQNVLDRAALRVLCAQHTVLVHQDLAQCIKHHFQDVLDQLNDADSATDTAPGPECW